jgi:Glyoxalase-like domain
MGDKSRVCAVLFDTKDTDYAATVKFWGGALGGSYEFNPEKRYTTLSGYLDYAIQNVGLDQEGVHIDIETDNVDAEVSRLEAIGARRKYKVKNWWVLEDPGGHAFCVVPVVDLAAKRNKIDGL